MKHQKFAGLLCGILLSICPYWLRAQGDMGGMGGGANIRTKYGTAQLAAAPNPYTGACPVTITFTGSAAAYDTPGNGMSGSSPVANPLDYQFSGSNGYRGPVSYAANGSSGAVSYAWQVAQSMVGWVALNGWWADLHGRAGHGFGARVNFAVNCLPAAQPRAHAPMNLQPRRSVFPYHPPYHYSPPKFRYPTPCPKPELIKLSDRSFLLGGHIIVLAQPGDNLEVLANTSLPAQVVFAVGNQRVQALSSSMNPNKLNQNQGYTATMIIIVVPQIATGSPQPVAGNVYLNNACGASHGMAIEYQGPQPGPYRAHPNSGPGVYHAPVYHPIYHPYHPVRRPLPQPTPPLTAQQQALRAQKLAELHQAFLRMAAQVHARVLAVQANWQRRQLARQAKLEQNLMAQERMPALRQAMQQNLGTIQQTILNISRVRQPVKIPVLNYHRGPILHPIGTAGTGSGDNLNPGNPCPAPVITSLSTQSGQYLNPLMINGSHFGTSGTVNFIIPPDGQTISGQVNQGSWTDGHIFITIPMISGFVNPYNGYIYVVNSCGQSNMQAFQFQPYMVIQPLPITDANVAWSDPNCPQNTAGTITAVEFLCQTTNGVATQALSSGIAGGAKNNDTYFQSYFLKNGWVLDSIDLEPCPWTPFGPSAGASAENYTVGSRTPQVIIHSWVNAAGFNATPPMEGYLLTIYVHGPAGTEPQ